MQTNLPAGKYVVAVSGGVDSVVLLDLLTHSTPETRNSKPHFIVAHFDHGIRPDSAEDCAFVKELAAKYGLAFVSERVELGAHASEARAREARYAFLRRVLQQEKADAIVTAHHQDDLLETIIINWLRGTKSRGLSSLRSTEEIRRPLLAFTKQQIYAYAKKHNLAWHEDTTNSDENYLRNYIRRRVIPKLPDKQRASLLAHSAKAAELNEAIGELVEAFLSQHVPANQLSRTVYRGLPNSVAHEVLAQWLRNSSAGSISQKLIIRLDTAIRRGRTNSRVDVQRGYVLKLEREFAVLCAPN